MCIGYAGLNIQIQAYLRAYMHRPMPIQLKVKFILFKVQPKSIIHNNIIIVIYIWATNGKPRKFVRSTLSNDT